MNYDSVEVFYDDSSIEHIIGEKEEYTKNIGNLILLEISVNQEASNLNYNGKIDIYRKSKYNFVKEFISENTEWSKEKIANRAENLARIYYTKILNLTI